MIKVMFVCHGNICRSPMAEFLFKDMVNKMGLSSLFLIDSCATSNEEIGNDIHYGTKDILDKHNIPYEKRKAYRLSKKMYQDYDYIICMDKNNLYNINYITNDTTKVKLLLEYCNKNRDVLDPWYTHNFDETYNDIKEGCLGFINYLKDKKII